MLQYKVILRSRGLMSIIQIYHDKTREVKGQVNMLSINYNKSWTINYQMNKNKVQE